MSRRTHRSRIHWSSRAAHFLVLLAAMALPISTTAQEQKPAETKEAQPVSYYRQVRPILQRNCSGCHQPAKAGGKLLLTSFEESLKGGENGALWEAGKPDDSLIVQYISGEKPMMPLNAEPLKPDQVALIARWIGEGAQNDTPAGVQDSVSAENPPTYSNAPVITALDYSPDSSLLAVSGYHEIVLHHADGSGPVGRLIGRAQRIESLRFSPDGATIGAVGGTPALFGEAQFWNVAERKLTSSMTVGYDTLFGASFSGDGQLFAFGAADNRARIIKTGTAEQTMRFDGHSDYVLATTFSLKNDHLITVSRDMSMKLVIVENGQLVDNITSITPGALKGGLMAVQRHPQQEQVLCGGADGTPMLYKIFRTRVRVIGDDFNHIRSYTKLPGRVCDLRFNADGSKFVVGSSTATGGAARIYRTGEYKTDEINNAGGLEDTRVAITERSKEEMLVHELPGIDAPVFTVAFRPDGKQVAVAGFDGTVRLYDAESGQLVKAFIPVELSQVQTAAN